MNWNHNAAFTSVFSLSANILCFVINTISAYIYLRLAKRYVALEPKFVYYFCTFLCVACTIPHNLYLAIRWQPVVPTYSTIGMLLTGIPFLFSTLSCEISLFYYALSRCLKLVLRTRYTRRFRGMMALLTLFCIGVAYVTLLIKFLHRPEDNKIKVMCRNLHCVLSASVSVTAASLYFVFSSCNAIILVPYFAIAHGQMSNSSVAEQTNRHIFYILIANLVFTAIPMTLNIVALTFFHFNLAEIFGIYSIIFLSINCFAAAIINKLLDTRTRTNAGLPHMSSMAGPSFVATFRQDMKS